MEGNWIENTGEMPVSPDTKVDFVFDDGEVFEGDPANYWYWGLDGGITHWRLHKEPSATTTPDEFEVQGWTENTGDEPPVFGALDIRFEDGHIVYDSEWGWSWDLEANYPITHWRLHNRDEDFVEVPEVENKPEVKNTNPKDMVGTRKAPLSTVPMNVIAEVGVAMLEGAAKYGRHNYRAVGVRASVYFDATMRHLLSWWEYEDIDPDSQINHITKAITSLVVLRDAMMQGKCTDDRPPRSKPFYGVLNTLAGEIIDKHSDKAPKHYTIEEV